MPNVPAWSPNWKEVRHTQDSLVHGVGRDNGGNTLRNAYVHKQQTHQSSSAEEVGKNLDVSHHTHSLPSLHHLVKKTKKKKEMKNIILSAMMSSIGQADGLVMTVDFVLLLVIL